MGWQHRAEKLAVQCRNMAYWLHRIHRADYLAAKRNDFRLFTRVALLITVAFMGTTIFWDYAIDPVHAGDAIGLRLIESLALLVWFAASWQNIHARLAKLAAIFAPLLISLTFIMVLSRLDGGSEYGIGGFLYFFIFLPFLLMGQSIRFAIAAMAVVCVFPLTLAPFGAVLPWDIYNAYVWMGFIPVVGIQFLCEYLYWRVFVYRGRVERLVVTDALTGLANRRRFFIESERILESHRRSQRRASLLFIDIDHFKQVNDRYGHIVGDAALCHVVHAIQAHVRKSDLMARYGGEEFVVLLPETSHRAALVAAERMRCAVADNPLEGAAGAPSTLALRVSIGVASYRPSARQTPDIDILIQNADDALYKAKKAGRDRVHGIPDSAGRSSTAAQSGSRPSEYRSSTP